MNYSFGYFETIPNDLVLIIFKLSNSLKIKQLCKHYLEICDKEVNMISEMTLNIVKMKNISQLPGHIVSFLLKNKEIFADILKRSEYFENVFRIRFNDFVYDLMHQKTSSITINIRQLTHAIANPQCSKHANIIVSLMMFENNHDIILNAIVTLARMCGNIYTNDLYIDIQTYCAYKNNFELYKKIATEGIYSGIYSGLDRGHIQYFVNHQNIEALNFLILRIWSSKDFHETILTWSIILCKNEVFDYFYKTFCTLTPSKITRIIELCIVYNNLYAFNKLIQTKSIARISNKRICEHQFIAIVIACDKYPEFKKALILKHYSFSETKYLIMKKSVLFSRSPPKNRIIYDHPKIPKYVIDINKHKTYYQHREPQNNKNNNRFIKFNNKRNTFRKSYR